MIEFVGIGICVCVIGLLLYARWNYGSLESMGFTVVKPLHFFLGNTADFHMKVTHLEDIKRFKKYGAIFGFYQGRTPEVHVCDAELMKAITVTDYEYFKDRPAMEFGSPFLNEMPDFISPHSKWKAVRQLLTPTFTSAKMKMMSSSMKDSLNDYGNSLKERINQSKSGKLEQYDLSEGIYIMLTDMIARCVFSINIENKTDGGNYFVQTLKRMIEGEGGAGTNTIMTPLSYAFPILNRLSKPLFDPKASEEMRIVLKNMVLNRIKSGEKKKDFVQQVVEWMDRLETPEFKNNNITEDTLLFQALVFFFAGQDQISTILAYTVLKISQNKEIEKKVYEEMEKHLQKHNQQIDYDSMTELTYLTACLTEATRLVPFFTRSIRICTKDWQNKDGIRIKKGTTVVFPHWAANRNPEYFPDPEKFDPERFMPENKHNLHPYAMTSFGFGPKNCVGMRFANDALLFSAAYLYKEFRFHAPSDMKLKYYTGGWIFAYCFPYFLEVTKK